jgi:hypothetical protein
VYGSVPPVAPKVAEYFVPTRAFCKLVVVMLKAAIGVTVTVEVEDFERSAELVAVTTAVVSVVTAGAV